MPVNDYQGQVCHRIFEVRTTLEEPVPDTIKCIAPGCDDPSCVADWIVLSRRLRTRSCSALSPFVYFKSASGEISFAGRSDEPTPQGYDRCEITTLHELQTFESQIRSRDHDEFRRNRENQQDLWDSYISAQRAKTREELASGNFTYYDVDPKTGEPIECVIHIENADESAPGGGHNRQLIRDLLEKAAKRSDSRSRFEAPEPNSYLSILHYDENNTRRFRQ